MLVLELLTCETSQIWIIPSYSFPSWSTSGVCLSKHSHLLVSPAHVPGEWPGNGDSSRWSVARESWSVGEARSECTMITSESGTSDYGWLEPVSGNSRSRREKFFIYIVIYDRMRKTGPGFMRTVRRVWMMSRGISARWHTMATLMMRRVYDISFFRRIRTHVSPGRTISHMLLR